VNVNTLVDIVRKLPGVYVDSWVVERTYGERTKLELVITVDEQPTLCEIVVRIEPTPADQAAEFERWRSPLSEGP
jgi:hypothetical protein